MRLINHFGSNLRQKDKFRLEARILGITLFELKFDISRRCFKLVILNVGFGTENCMC
jgi:hypothetical protein